MWETDNVVKMYACKQHLKILQVGLAFIQFKELHPLMKSR